MLLHPGIGGRRRMVLGLASAFLTGYHIWIAHPVRFQRIRPRRRNRRPGRRGWTHKNERRLRLACYANHSSRLNFCNHVGNRPGAPIEGEIRLQRKSQWKYSAEEATAILTRSPQ